ncbi:GNAT family N-acetyltransferase [Adlercreutzia sp. ZJ141]|uniref:GNAT family N-acetyltransferase n=1 Tax=Adlercreutzia sp. ZJ141 TaxID=2709406 RepID=UPI0013EAB0A4|nr:GNAT family N-acetyltransferase [Adlercreutzia sp. ZJ141]
MTDIKIRIATLKDAEALLAIYSPYVLNTAVTFEDTPPTLEEFSKRMGTYLARYPYLAAIDCEHDDEVVGFTYAGPFKQRSAYDWAVETSIYVRQGERGRGVGRLLYETLEAVLRKQGFTNMNAAVAYPLEEDEYLTRNSFNFHERMGFSYLGRFTKCGHKFGRWYDMCWMEKHIAPHLAEQPPIVPFPALRDQLDLEELVREARARRAGEH